MFVRVHRSFRFSSKTAQFDFEPELSGFLFTAKTVGFKLQTDQPLLYCDCEKTSDAEHRNKSGL